MFDVGWSELVVIAVVALVVIGPKELPTTLRTIGKMTARASGEFGAHHGDTVYLTPDETRLHRFDDKGLRIAG